MASTAQLKSQGRDLEARLANFAKEFEENDSISEAEKETAYKALEEDFATWKSQMKRCEGASDMDEFLKKGGVGDAFDTKTGKSIAKYEMPNPLSKYGRKQLAAMALEDEKFASLIGTNDITRKALEHSFEIGLKANPTGSAEGDNLMGDFILPQSGGATGPTAIGQNPFGTGAFAPGILPDFRPGIVEQLFYKITIPDLISSFATSAPNISYLTESFDNFQANQVAEAGTFPFSSLDVSRVYAQVGKVANAMTISDEAIADAATLFNFVQGRLLMGVQRQEEVQILAGSGYPGVGGLLSFGSSFTSATSALGSLYNAGTATTMSSVAFPTSGTLGAGAASQTITTLNVGRVVTGAHAVYPDPLTVSLNLKDAATDIELSVFESPTAHIMNPRDWQLLETAQDANQQFMNTSMFGNVYGVSRGPVQSLWGVPVVTTPLMPKGLILTGWFDPQTVQVARRAGIQMQMTNANESDFIQGKVTVRADSRLGLLCYRPTAFELTHLVVGP